MGFANIAAHNGWSMALLGISIVMTGLIVLSLAISQIHKLVAFWERRQAKAAQAPAPVVEPEIESPAPSLSGQCPINLDELEPGLGRPSLGDVPKMRPACGFERWPGKERSIPS